MAEACNEVTLPPFDLTKQCAVTHDGERCGYCQGHAGAHGVDRAEGGWLEWEEPPIPESPLPEFHCAWHREAVRERDELRADREKALDERDEYRAVADAALEFYLARMADVNEPDAVKREREASNVFNNRMAQYVAGEL